LPAYNEAESIETLIEKVEGVASGRPEQLCIVACDDGSNDATPRILARLASAGRIHLITHALNRGLGETIRDLFEFAAVRAQDTDIVVRMDSDDTHEPSYMPAMIAKLDEGNDVVIASRFAASSGGEVGLTGARKLVSRAANLFMRLFFPLPGVREYSCGYRAYRGSIVKRAIAVYGNDFIQLKGFGFACTLEKLVKMGLLKARMSEIPFVLRYDQKMSVSKMVASVTTLGYLVMVLMHYWPWGGWRTHYRRVSWTDRR
jgi:dolichol-phosphate mannosyltransferase